MQGKKNQQLSSDPTPVKSFTSKSLLPSHDPLDFAKEGLSEGGKRQSVGHIEMPAAVGHQMLIFEEKFAPGTGRRAYAAIFRSDYAAVAMIVHPMPQTSQPPAAEQDIIRIARSFRFLGTPKASQSAPTNDVNALRAYNVTMKENNTRLILRLLRTGVEQYVRKYGHPPRSLGLLLSSDFIDNMKELPPAMPGNLHQPSNEEHNFLDPASNDQGGWGYVEETGKVFVNCSHQDSSGIQWDQQ